MQDGLEAALRILGASWPDQIAAVLRATKDLGALAGQYVGLTPEALIAAAEALRMERSRLSASDNVFAILRARADELGREPSQVHRAADTIWLDGVGPVTPATLQKVRHAHQRLALGAELLGLLYGRARWWADSDTPCGQDACPQEVAKRAHRPDGAREDAVTPDEQRRREAAACDACRRLHDPIHCDRVNRDHALDALSWWLRDAARDALQVAGDRLIAQRRAVELMRARKLPAEVLLDERFQKAVATAGITDAGPVLAAAAHVAGLCGPGRAARVDAASAEDLRSRYAVPVQEVLQPLRTQGAIVAAAQAPGRRAAAGGGR